MGVAATTHVARSAATSVVVVVVVVLVVGAELATFILRSRPSLARLEFKI